VKQLRFIFIVALVNLIRVMITVAIGMRVDPIAIGLSVGFVVLAGLLTTLKMLTISRELDDRLKSLAAFRGASQELERVETQFRDISYNGERHLYVVNADGASLVSPISLSEDGATWVAGAPIAIGSPPVAIEQPVADNPKIPEEPTPENRLSRVLKDNYPL
jgi:hypothetical protein